jgi:hypothetical protein
VKLDSRLQKPAYEGIQLQCSIAWCADQFGKAVDHAIGLLLTGMSQACAVSSPFQGDFECYGDISISDRLHPQAPFLDSNLIEDTSGPVTIISDMVQPGVLKNTLPGNVSYQCER